MNTTTIVALAFLLLSLGVIVCLLRVGLATFQPWLRAMFAGKPVSAMHLLRLWREGISPKLIVDAYLLMHYAGRSVPLETIVEVYRRRRVHIFTSQDLVEHVTASSP